VLEGGGGTDEASSLAPFGWTKGPEGELGNKQAPNRETRTVATRLRLHPPPASQSPVT
jgi:hypothetical protein